ncbi:MAG: hypothetical protein DI533_00185 [Cereibacter sphaeroides]|uniref:Uncharacterized protein n=1 Tax=Cereibacter sphaeroides TaxID=1063 RepID=A0A2W5SNF2_CERSP|nr:MAG: hypothetical protein DI533_00185 [Cereibacter sphaeroides]
MSGLGHNGGPTLEAGGSWRLHCWNRARADLLPHLPIEVLRTRVRRAGELGLDYRTYASVRAATGHDVVAFLFSSNALRVLPRTQVLPQDRLDKLQAISASTRIGLAQSSVDPGHLMQLAMGALDQTHKAPMPLATFPAARAALREALGKMPGDQVILVGDTSLEQEWCAAARLAAWLPADRYFART